MALLSVMALTLGSCTEEYEYSAAKVEGQQVYFSNALGSTLNLSNTESSKPHAQRRERHLFYPLISNIRTGRQCGAVQPELRPHEAGV